MTRITYDGKEMILDKEFEKVSWAIEQDPEWLTGTRVISAIIEEGYSGRPEELQAESKRRVTLRVELITYIEDMEGIE